MRLNSTTSNSNTSQPWKLEYDSILQQYYYINLLDNSISFDSPCEVMNHKKSSSTNKNYLHPSRNKENITNITRIVHFHVVQVTTPQLLLPIVIVLLNQNQFIAD